MTSTPSSKFPTGSAPSTSSSSPSAAKVYKRRTKITRQLSGVPFGWEMLPQALPWILDQMRVNGKYSNDALKGYLARAYDVETLKVSQDWPEDGMKLFHNYVDWLVAKMTEDGWHRPLGKKMYELTGHGVRKAGELGY